MTINNLFLQHLSSNEPLIIIPIHNGCNAVGNRIYNYLHSQLTTSLSYLHLRYLRARFTPNLLKDYYESQGLFTMLRNRNTSVGTDCMNGKTNYVAPVGNKDAKAVVVIPTLKYNRIVLNNIKCRQLREIRDNSRSDTKLI